MFKQDLNQDSFLILAAKAFDKPTYMMEEFHEDLKRLRHIKIHINRYLRGCDLNYQIVLNHVIILCNSFGQEFAIRLLFYSMNEEQLPVIKSMLIALKRLPKIVLSVKGKDIYTCSIEEDQEVLEKIRKELRV